MITLYGISASRAFRNLWLLEELGLEYSHVPVDYRGDEVGQPDFLALNPNGRIPVLTDGDLVLWESMAINLYLASRYGREQGFWPQEPAGQGLCYQWSFWVMTEVEQHLLSLLMHGRLLPEDKRDTQKAQRSEGCLKAPFAVLEQALAGRDYLLGDDFTVADLNVAAVLGWAKAARMDLKGLPALNDWLGRCMSRPANRQARVR